MEEQCTKCQAISLQLEANLVHTNAANSYGGVLNLGWSNITVAGIEFSTTEPCNEYGGAVILWSSVIVMDGTNFTSNSANIGAVMYECYKQYSKNSSRS